MDRAWDIEDPMLEMSAKRLVEASESGHRPNILLAEQVAYTLALHLSDRYAAPGPFNSGRVPTLDEKMRERIAEFVRADLGTPVTLAAMAKVAGMSVSCFIRTFKRSTGVTPHRFVVEQRIHEASRLLATSDLPIVEIALMFGFSSQSHFGVAFRTVTGKSPALYRRLQRGSE